MPQKYGADFKPVGCQALGLMEAVMTRRDRCHGT